MSFQQGLWNKIICFLWAVEVELYCSYYQLLFPPLFLQGHTVILPVSWGRAGGQESGVSFLAEGRLKSTGKRLDLFYK